MKSITFKEGITCYTYRANANPNIDILMSENIGQRRLNFSLDYFDALLQNHQKPLKNSSANAGKCRPEQLQIHILHSDIAIVSFFSY